MYLYKYIYIILCILKLNYTDKFFYVIGNFDFSCSIV